MEQEKVTQTVSQDFTAGESSPFLIVKYDGEERPLTKEEAITLAQKGMNYDRAAGQRDALGARARLLEQQLGAMQTRLAQGLPSAAQKMEGDWLRFIEKYPDVKPSEQLLESVWQEIEGGKSPGEAYADFLNEALRQQVGQLKLALAQAQKSSESRRKSPGSTASVTGFVTDADPFLEGLLSGF